MSLSGLEIYKLLPKTNCKECGFPTCLAFAMQLAKKAIELSKCPHIKEGIKAKLEASSLPPIRLIKIGKEPNITEIGSETVLFRHEEKFHHPTCIGIIIDDTRDNSEAITKINKLSFERVGQELKVDIIALEQKKGRESFLETLKYILDKTELKIALMSNDIKVLKDALEISRTRVALIYAAGKDNFKEYVSLASDYKVPLVLREPNLADLPEITSSIKGLGLENVILDTGTKSIQEKLWDLTEIRRMALKKNMREYGYPVICIVETADTFDAINEAGVYLAKYASIILLRHREPWQILALLTLGQNIYTDPQKPLQVEPKDYPIGQVTKDSPVLVTTNFSLSYYTVLGEVEASKVPSHIISIDTEGMSVLTAWAAEKFTPEKIAESIKKSGIEEKINHKNLIIPGYVAVMSGDLEEKSGWKVTVGPKEASGIPSFLKKLN